MYQVEDKLGNTYLKIIKIHGLFLISIVALFLMILMLSSCKHTGTPRGLVQEFIDAVKARNYDRILVCFPESVQKAGQYQKNYGSSPYRVGKNESFLN